MSGFVADGDDGRVLTNFTAELPGRTKARRLYKSEWDIVLGLARNILDVSFSQNHFFCIWYK